jgi:hypothetical protein
MDGLRHDSGPDRRDELDRMDALDMWRALLSALSLYAPTPHVRAAAIAALHEIAERSPHVVAAYASDIAEVLDVEERRTRWEALSTLAVLAEDDAAALAPVAELVSGVLYQQESPAMRRVALHILNEVSLASDETRAQVWPLLDEALLMLRGEPEYPSVLATVVLLLSAGLEDTDHLWDYALQDADDRRARVRVLAHHMRQLLERQ